MTLIVEGTLDTLPGALLEELVGLARRDGERVGHLRAPVAATFTEQPA